MFTCEHDRLAATQPFVLKDFKFALEARRVANERAQFISRFCRHLIFSFTNSCPLLVLVIADSPADCASRDKNFSVANAPTRWSRSTPTRHAARRSRVV